MKGKMLVISLIAAGLIGCGAVGYSGGIGSFVSPNAAMTRPAPDTAVTAAASNASALPNFEGIAARYGPAVVNVSVTEEVKPTASVPDRPQLGPSDPSDPFFKRFPTPPAPRRDAPMRGVGSGFMVSPDGVILTNAHVVEDAKQVDVKLTDRREFRAKVIGIDQRTDIAVLKINAKDLPIVKLGNPAELKVGEWVVAIGSPFGFENSVTKGIVSAKSRTLPDDTYVPFIQTDVPVNPGNSGGPLFNMKGEVIGMNAQIYSHSGGYEGLSFAIPIDIAASVGQQILEHGQVTRGYLGVTVQELTQSLADAFGLKTLEGTLVSAVAPGGPAAKAGVEAGDVILKFDGKEITNSADLPVRVANLRPGVSVKLEVLRKGATKQFDVTLGKLGNAVVGAVEPGTQSRGRLGLMVRPLTPEERQQVGDGIGLLVENVAGPAAQAGIRPGDLIIAMDGTPVTSAKQLSELVARAGRRIALLVQRDNVKIFVPVDLG
jgi:serine protease Do